MQQALAKSTPLRFSTKFQDDESDLLSYTFRFYNPSTGRWLSRDPIDERGGTALYAYTVNSPATFVDPLGLQIFTIDITAKSWIYKPITAGWVTGMDPLHYPLLLADVQIAELLTSDNGATDAIDGLYRLLSQKVVTVDCCGSYLSSFHFSDLFTDIGREGWFYPEEAIVADDRGYRGSASSVRLTWMIKGKPAWWAEPGFQAVRTRTSVYIWHRIYGSIKCVSGRP